MPFLFVQLAPFLATSTVPQDTAWAELRDAQLHTYQTLPGMRQAASQQQADAMIGYQIYLGATRLSAFGGVELQSHENADLNAAERGSTIGGKGQLEAYSPFGEKFFGWGMATYRATTAAISARRRSATG